MVIIDTLLVNDGTHSRSVELCHGDLTELSPAERVDILVVSAYPGSYRPLPGTLIGALDRKGIRLEDLFRRRKVDLRAHHACWLSEKIEQRQPGIEFSYILCFEPEGKGSPPSVMGDIFRAIYPFTAEGRDITIAMPPVAAGYQGWPSKRIIPPLLDAAYNWMKNGIGIKTLKICLHDRDDIRDIPPQFGRIKGKYMKAGSSGADETGGKNGEKFDVFLSYSHADSKEARALLGSIVKSKPGLRVFFDRLALDTGAAWQKEIFDALENCRAVIALLSPAYLSSKVCMEEYHIAHARQRDAGKEFLMPVLLRETDLPYYMKSLQYVDMSGGVREAKKEMTELLRGLQRRVSARGPAGAGPIIRVTAAPESEDDHGSRVAAVISAIEALKKVYGRRMGIAAVARHAGLTPGETEILIETMILEGKLKATIGVGDSALPEEHILSVRGR